MGEKDPQRRASDDTRQRIENLAGGWDVPAREAAPAEEPKPAAKPPPPPPAARTKGPTRPPPLPPAPPPSPAAPPPRAARPSAPPPVRAPVIESIDDRDDATRVDPTRADAIAGAARLAGNPRGAVLRAPAAFRRRPGLTGDVVYVFTVLVGKASARRELARLDAAIDQGRILCEQKMIALGADGLADPSLDDDRLASARDALTALEEERSAKAGQAAAAEADLATIKRNERGEVERQTAEAKTIEAALAALAAKLAPLEKQAAALRRRGDELRATLAGIDDQIRALEASAVSARGGQADRAGFEAELATLRADRLAVAKDEPLLVAQHDDLDPQIAALIAERNRATRRLADARAAITAAAERAADEVGAVHATRKVIDRGLGDLEKRRDRALGALGEHLANERPSNLASPLAALDDAEQACVLDERRATELREMLASVDRRAFARGVAVLAFVVALLAAFGYFLAARQGVV